MVPGSEDLGVTTSPGMMDVIIIGHDISNDVRPLKQEYNFDILSLREKVRIYHLMDTQNTAQLSIALFDRSSLTGLVDGYHMAKCWGEGKRFYFHGAHQAVNDAGMTDWVVIAMAADARIVGSRSSLVNHTVQVNNRLCQLHEGILELDLDRLIPNLNRNAVLIAVDIEGKVLTLAKVGIAYLRIGRVANIAPGEYGKN